MASLYGQQKDLDEYQGRYSPVLYNIQKDVGIRRENGAMKLKKLKPIHKKIIAMHLSCIPTSEIAAIVGKSYAWVSTVLSDPLSQKFINDFDDMTRKEFNVLRAKANAALRDGLSEENSISIRLRAADLFSKRAGDYLPENREPPASAEDVIQRMLSINIQVNNGGQNAS